MKNVLKFFLLKYWTQLKKNTRKQLMNENDQIFNHKLFFCISSHLLPRIGCEEIGIFDSIDFYARASCICFLFFFCSIQFEKRNLPLRQAWGLSGQRPRNKNNQHRIKYHPNPVGGAFDWARTRVVPVRVCSPVRPNCIVHRTVLTLAMDAFWDFLLLWLLAACYIGIASKPPRGKCTKSRSRYQPPSETHTDRSIIDVQKSIKLFPFCLPPLCCCVNISHWMEIKANKRRIPGS